MKILKVIRGSEFIYMLNAIIIILFATIIFFAIEMYDILVSNFT